MESETTDLTRLFNRAAKAEKKGVWQDEALAKEWDNNRDEYREELFSEIESKVEDLENAGLSSQEAKVAALKSEDFSHMAVALALEIDPSTVGEYTRRVREKLENSERLIDVTRDYNVDNTIKTETSWEVTVGIALDEKGKEIEYLTSDEIDDKATAKRLVERVENLPLASGVSTPIVRTEIEG